MATPAELRLQFEERMKEGIPNPPGSFHPADLERIKSDQYLQRFIGHMEGDLKGALDMLWEAMIWRKNVGASDINESNIRMDYIQEGAFFPHGRDVDGYRLLIFKSKMHTKGSKDWEELKRCFIYWFDRIEREENGKPLTLFFDMDGAGLSNVDLEFTKYLINLVKLYYPYFLNYIIIFEMPWMLNATFQVIKQLLPAKGVAKMKFLKKSTLKEYVSPEQALISWGGTNDYEFKFVPEEGNPQVSPEHGKKVTFAEGEAKNTGELLSIKPSDTILFKREKDDISGTFTIVNVSDSDVYYKIRTTAPEKFRVRPFAGTLAKGASQSILIVVQTGFQLKSITKDRFLLMALKIPKMDMTQQEITELWQKNSGKTDEYRLKCQFEDALSINGNSVDNLEISDKNFVTVKNGTETIMRMKMDSLHNEMKTLKIMNVSLIFLSICSIIISVLVYYRQDENMYCSKI